jgi:hypothetical protein
VRDLPVGSVGERFEGWMERPAGASDSIPLRGLYQGEAWSQVAPLECALNRAGFEPELFVASAGLGLRPVTSCAPSYSATFATNQQDSVGSSKHETQTWWRLLLEASPTADPSKVFSRPSLFVLSESYATAMDSELTQLAHREDVLVFGGTQTVPSHQRVPADLGLRRELGGTATSINLRTATSWASRLNSPRLVTKQIRTEWDAWVTRVRVTEAFDRQTLGDMDLIGLIRDLRTSNPSITKTRALRMLRDSGVACEQKRFGQLFEKSGRS